MSKGPHHGWPGASARSRTGTAAAQLLDCSPAQVGYCPRCQSLSRRYGTGAEVICRACRAAEASSADGPAR
ncbi:hypothetical protein CQW39_31770 [Streptomyces griseofuscus]|nr:hypothetical protein CQW39_31770 [Streptomyces griseofuscus]